MVGYEDKALAEALGECRDGYSLPAAFYRSGGIYEAELRSIFAGQWLLAAHESELPRPGFLICDCGRESIVLTRDRQGGIRAFFNVCRHRGARLRPFGAHSGETLACQYHCW